MTTTAQRAAVVKKIIQAFRTCLPNSNERDIDHRSLNLTLEEKQRKIAEKKGRRSRDIFEAVCQDLLPKKWTISGVMKVERTILCN